MDPAPIIIAALGMATAVAVVAIFIYLIAKRIDDKQNENFEDRDH